MIRFVFFVFDNNFGLKCTNEKGRAGENLRIGPDLELGTERVNGNVQLRDRGTFLRAARNILREI